MIRDSLTTADLLGMHAILIRRYGGADGVRDMGAVEAEVFRPQCGNYADIVQEACALLENLLINPPFVDGNKRGAFAACDVFLQITDFRLMACTQDLLKLMLHWISLKPQERFQAIEAALRPLSNEE